MKRILTVILIFLLVFSAFTACTNTAPSSQTPEVSNSAKPQATQQIHTPTPSASITKEPQPSINNNNAITKAEVLAFFNSENEFATRMLLYPATDMNNLEQVILMILYPLGGSSRNQISFDVFNEYAKKYLKKSYADSEFAKYATDEDVVGNNVIMGKRVLYFSGLGGTDILIKNVEITGNDSALLTCSWGLNRDEPDTMDEVSFCVQFGRVNSQLYIKSIWRTDKTRISNRFSDLGNFDKCFWKESIIGDPRLAGPGSRWMKGFVLLNSETLAKFKKDLKWSSMPEGWQPSLDTEILITGSIKWSYCYDYIIKSNFKGNLYFDLVNGIVFFDVQL